MTTEERIRNAINEELREKTAFISQMITSYAYLAEKTLTEYATKNLHELLYSRAIALTITSISEKKQSIITGDVYCLKKNTLCPFDVVDMDKKDIDLTNFADTRFIFEEIVTRLRDSSGFDVRFDEKKKILIPLVNINND